MQQGLRESKAILNRDLIVATIENVLQTGGKRGRTPELWDGRAAERIVGVLAERVCGAAPASC
jgi:UDP-N-acetylglucosamine 2-epimerase (non-hydrolysing)